jgi:pimeloyl-ACP methyl ester carboxylesterase
MEVFGRGLGEGRDSWREVAWGLAPCLTVVLYDRPGIGGSPAPQDPGNPVLAAAVASISLSSCVTMACLDPFSWWAIHSAGYTSKHSPATIPMRPRAW